MDSEQSKQQLEETVAKLKDAGEDESKAYVGEIESLVANDILATSYSRLQFIIGLLAFSLPVVVSLFDWLIDGEPLRGSISSYYYGRTGGYFVGSLCAIGVFLLSYNYRPRPGFEQDNVLSNVGAAAVISVALFPTSSKGAEATGGSQAVAYIHVAAAAVFFVILAILALFYFTRIDALPRGFRASLRRALNDEDGASERQRQDNLIYRVCGWTIVVSLVLIAINNALDLGLLFWLEGVIVWAFGVAWLRKSRNVTSAARGARRLLSGLIGG